MMKVYTWLIIGAVLFCTSCTKKNRFSEVPEQDNFKVEIVRFDKDFIALNTQKMDEAIGKLYRDYPLFLPKYLTDVLGTNPTDTVQVARLITGFLTDTAFTAVNKKVLSVFDNVKPYEQALTTSLGLMHHYFPQLKTPEVYFFVSGFNRSIITTDDFIGIGVDLYLGSDYPKYSEITYEYLTYNMRPENVVPDVVSAFIFKSFPVDYKDNRLLENMIYRGKLMYLFSSVMPGYKPHDLMGYSSLQWEWCRKYEKEIWQVIVDQRDLFSSDMMLIGKYVNDAPFTSPVSQESPGRLGTWVGWQIVNKYMDKNQDITLEQLMKETNYQKILDGSGYNP